MPIAFDIRTAAMNFVDNDEVKEITLVIALLHHGGSPTSGYPYGPNRTLEAFYRMLRL